MVFLLASLRKTRLRQVVYSLYHQDWEDVPLLGHSVAFLLPLEGI
jgi:hypothetical protein